MHLCGMLVYVLALNNCTHCATYILLRQRASVCECRNSSEFDQQKQHDEFLFENRAFSIRPVLVHNLRRCDKANSQCLCIWKQRNTRVQDCVGFQFVWLTIPCAHCVFSPHIAHCAVGYVWIMDFRDSAFDSCIFHAACKFPITDLCYNTVHMSLH